MGHSVVATLTIQYTFRFYGLTHSVTPMLLHSSITLLSTLSGNRLIAPPTLSGCAHHGYWDVEEITTLDRFLCRLIPRLINNRFGHAFATGKRICQKDGTFIISLANGRALLYLYEVLGQKMRLILSVISDTKRKTDGRKE